MNVCIHIFIRHRCYFIKVLVWWSIPSKLIFLLFEHIYWSIFKTFCYVYLSFNHLANSLFVMSKTNFLNIILSDIFESIELSYFLLFHRVDIKIHIIYNNFLFEIIKFFLLLLLELFYHVVSTDENSFKVFSI